MNKTFENSNEQMHIQDKLLNHFKNMDTNKAFEQKLESELSDQSDKLNSKKIFSWKNVFKIATYTTLTAGLLLTAGYLYLTYSKVYNDEKKDALNNDGKKDNNGENHGPWTFEQRLASIINTPETPKVFYGINPDIVTTNTQDKEINDCYLNCTPQEKLIKAIHVMRDLTSVKVTKDITYKDGTREKIIGYVSRQNGTQRELFFRGKSELPVKERVILGNTTYTRIIDTKTNKWSAWQSESTDNFLYEYVSAGRVINGMQYVSGFDDVISEGTVLNSNAEVSEKYLSDKGLEKVLTFNFGGDWHADTSVVITPALSVKEMTLVSDDQVPGDTIKSIKYSYENFNKPFGVMPIKVMTGKFPGKEEALDGIIRQLQDMKSRDLSYIAYYRNTADNVSNIIYANKHGEEQIQNIKSIGKYEISDGQMTQQVLVLEDKKYSRKFVGNESVWTAWEESDSRIGESFGTSDREVLSFLFEKDIKARIKNLNMKIGYSDLLREISFTYESRDKDNATVTNNVSLNIDGYYEVVSVKIDSYKGEQYLNSVLVDYDHSDPWLRVVNPISSGEVSEFTSRCTDLEDANINYNLSLVIPSNVSASALVSGKDHCVIKLSYNDYNMYMQRVPVSLDDTQTENSFGYSYQELESTDEALKNIRRRDNNDGTYHYFYYDSASKLVQQKYPNSLVNWKIVIISPERQTTYTRQDAFNVLEKSIAGLSFKAE